MSFDYTKFLNKQNEVYLSKYANEPVQSQKTLKPISGYSGFKPTYRGSSQEQRVIRSLIRCLDKEEPSAKNIQEKDLANSVPSTSYSCGSNSTKISLASQSSSPASRASSSISHRSLPPEKLSDHPRGPSRTVYGQNFGFNWSNEVKAEPSQSRIKEAEKEKKLNSNHGLIYRKHGGIIPKYQGHVPNYKFRYGASFAALTFNPTIEI